MHQRSNISKPYLPKINTFALSMRKNLFFAQLGMALCLFCCLCVPLGSLSAQEICADGIDNDADELIDALDPQCVPVLDLPCTPFNTYYMPSVWLHSTLNSPAYFRFTTPAPLANVRMRSADGSFDNNYTVSAGTPLVINTTQVMSQNINAVRSNEGFIIESDVPISAVYITENGLNSSIILIKGKEALGRAFRIATPSRTGIAAPDERHYASIIATEDNTNVTFSNPGGFRGVAGTTITATLNRGQTYMVQPTDANQSFPGLLVTADRPVVANAGCQHTQTGPDREGQNDQLLPVTTVGTEYVPIRGSSAQSQEYVMVVGVENNTTVTLDGVNVGTVNAGQRLALDITGTLGTPHYIQTSQPASVFQISGLLAGRGEVDYTALPALNVSNCVGNRYVEFTRLIGTNTGYILCPTANLGSLTFRGVNYTTYGTAVPVPLRTDYSLVVLDNTDIAGTGISNVITCDAPVIVGLLVANGGTGSYGYFTSYDYFLEAINPNTGFQAEYYEVATLLPGGSTSTSLLLESCVAGYSILSATSGNGATIAPSGISLNYTAPNGFNGVDVVKVVFQNGAGFQSSVCLGFRVAGENCFNGVDDDADGLTDCADADCQPGTTLSYPTLSACTNDGNLAATAGPAGGIFSAAPAGLALNPLTGEVQLASSTPGNYVITHTIAATATACAESASFNLTVTAPAGQAGQIVRQ